MTLALYTNIYIYIYIYHDIGTVYEYIYCIYHDIGTKLISHCSAWFRLRTVNAGSQTSCCQGIKTQFVKYLYRPIKRQYNDLIR